VSDDDDEEVAVARIDGYEADALATDDEELEEDEDTLCTNLKCCISIHAVDKSEEGRRRRRKTLWTFSRAARQRQIFFFERKNNFFLLVRAHAKKALRCFSMQRLAFALVMSAAILLVVVLALRCIIFRQFFFFMPRVSRDNEV